MPSPARISFPGVSKITANTFTAPQSIIYSSQVNSVSFPQMFQVQYLVSPPAADGTQYSAAYFLLNINPTANPNASGPNAAVHAKLQLAPPALAVVDFSTAIWADVQAFYSQGQFAKVDGIYVTVNSDTSRAVSFNGIEVASIVAPGSTNTGLRIANQTSGAVNYAIFTGTGPVVFGDLLTDTTGINFGQTTLNQYQEGTFAPTLNGFTIVNGIGLVTATGKYTRVGNVVNFTVVISVIGNATIAANFPVSNVSGLPFTASQLTAIVGAMSGFGFNAIGYIPSGSTSIDLNTWAAVNQNVVLSGSYLI